MADSKNQNAKPDKKFQISAPAPGSLPPIPYSQFGALRPILPPPITKKGYVLPRYVTLDYVEFTL